MKRSRATMKTIIAGVRRMRKFLISKNIRSYGSFKYKDIIKTYAQNVGAVITGHHYDFVISQIHDPESVIYIKPQPKRVRIKKPKLTKNSAFSISEKPQVKKVKIEPPAPKVWSMPSKNVSLKEYYAKYLESNKWKRFRKSILISRGSMCEKCNAMGESVILHVHHLTYKNIFNERPEDVQILCEECHKKEHGVKSFRRRKKKKEEPGDEFMRLLDETDSSKKMQPITTL